MELPCGWTCVCSRFFLGGSSRNRFLSEVATNVVHVSEALVFTPLPEGWEDLSPGPQLGAMVATIDRTRLNGYQLVELVAARQRQLCWQQAQLLADMHELAYTPPGRPDAAPLRQGHRDRHVVEEVSFALAWTMAAAEDQLALAFNMITGQPAVYTALRQGRIDLAKAKVILHEVDLMHVATSVIVQVRRGESQW
jgi:hypothetical protein